MERENIQVYPKGSRDPLHPDISEEMIKKLVHGFYDQIREDEDLGPIFNDAIEDWDFHLDRMCDFWSSVSLKSGRYKGRPVPAHMKLEGLTSEHFLRWLSLFRQTANDICGPEIGAHFIERAERIAESLQLAIFSQGQFAPPGLYKS